MKNRHTNNSAKHTWPVQCQVLMGLPQEIQEVTHPELLLVLLRMLCLNQFLTKF